MKSFRKITKIFSGRYQIAFLLVCFFISFRLASFLNYFIKREAYFVSDNAIYAVLAERLLSGDFYNGFHPYWNSGFPLMTIPFYLFTKSWESAQYLLSVSATCALILLLYWMLKKNSLVWAITAAFIASFSPSLSNLVNGWGMSEPIYIVWLWLGIYFGWQTIILKKNKDLIFTGIFFGLAYLTRTEALFTVLSFLIFLTLSYYLKLRSNTGNSFVFKLMNKFSLSMLLVLGTSHFISIMLRNNFLSKTTLTYRPSASLIALSIIFLLLAMLGAIFQIKKDYKNMSFNLRFIKKILIILSFFLLINIPYILVISNQLGKITINGKYSYLGSGHPFTPERDRMTTWAQDIWSTDYPNFKSPYYDPIRAWGSAWRGLDASAEAIVGKIISNISYLKAGNIFNDSEFYIVLISYLLMITNSRFRKFGIYLGGLWVGSLLGVSYGLEMSFRYMAFTFPLFYILGGYFIWVLASFIGNKLNKSSFKTISFSFVILLSFYLFLLKNYQKLDNYFYAQKVTISKDQKIIGDYLKRHSIKVVMGRTEGISYYSRAKMVYLPAANPETIVKFAKGWGVEYILARPAETSWDYMKVIANPDFSHSDLKLVYRFNDGSLIWKVKLSEEEKLHNFRTDKDVNEVLLNININSQTSI